MNLKLSISTCPNDTFMFDAIINKRIDTLGFEFDLHMADIEELNEMAMNGYSDISKISCAVFPEIASQYRILDSGSALGYGNGPLLVSKKKIYPDEIADLKIAVPGQYTTANALLTTLFPDVKERRYYLFSDIADVVMSEECDAGVLIHEGRFTYRDHGLKLIADLGELWEKEMATAVPLGSIAIKRSIDNVFKGKFGKLLHDSIVYAMANPKASAEFVKKHAQELSDDVICKHIDLFVNKYSLSLGEQGRKAICKITSLEESEIF